jgi:nucleotide-binding universal stress UspA family protein
MARPESDSMSRRRRTKWPRPQSIGESSSASTAPTSKVAADWAARDAALRKVPLTLVHVLSPPGQVGEHGFDDRVFAVVMSASATGRSVLVKNG